MKFTADSHIIQEGINIVTRALASKSPTAILEGICMDVNDNTLTLTGSDGQLAIRWSCPVNASESGTTIIPGRMASELIRKLPSAPVTFKSSDTTMTINYNKSHSRLAIISGTFPEMRDITDAYTLTLPMSALKDLISHVQSCIATDESRPILTGGLLDITPDAITMVALDGFRLALKRIAQDNPIPDGKEHIQSVIPRKTLTELSRIIPASDDPLTVTIGSNFIRFSFGAVQIQSILLSGEFIDYSRIIPASYTSSVRTDMTAIQTAIDRASLMAREGKNKLIRFDISGETLTISSRAETGNVDEEVECLSYGDNISISFNSNYLSDAIRNIPGDTVTIKFNSSTAPCVFTPESGDDWLYLILPVRTYD